MSDPYGGIRMGVQGYSMREFSLEKVISETSGMGLHFIEMYPGQFPFDADDAVHQRIAKLLEEHDITLNAYGVVGLDGDAAANRQIFEFARKMGIETLTADPTPDALANVEALMEEFQVNVAIHNHGPDSQYDKLEDIVDALAGRNPRLGACVDTGHFLRSGVDPETALITLGDRVLGLHHKDIDAQHHDAVLGQGILDQMGVVRALREIGFEGFFSLEYEAHPENPVPHMEACLAHLRQLLKDY